MGTPLDDLLDLLELETLEVNLFRGVSPDEDRQRVFGGQVAAQALVAHAARALPASELVWLMARRAPSSEFPALKAITRIRASALAGPLRHYSGNLPGR